MRYYYIERGPHKRFINIHKRCNLPNMSELKSGYDGLRDKKMYVKVIATQYQIL